jgi:hypothetical protein
MGRIAIIATAPTLASVLAEVLTRDGAEVLRIGHSDFAGAGGRIIENLLDENAVAEAFATVGVLDGLACLTADEDSVNPEDLSWSRWTAASRSHRLGRPRRAQARRAACCRRRGNRLDGGTGAARSCRGGGPGPLVGSVPRRKWRFRRARDPGEPRGRR